MEFFGRLFRKSASETKTSSRPEVEAPAVAQRSPQRPTPSPETPPPPTGPTAYCDICGATVRSNDLHLIPLRKMQQAVRDGFNPYQTPGMDMSRSVAVGLAAGLSSGQLFAEWREILMRDTTDWKLCRLCLTAFQEVTREPHAATAAPERVTDKAQPHEFEAVLKLTNAHYMLECVGCGFTHHIPREFTDSTMQYSVDVDEVTMVCVYGSSGDPKQFTVTLGVKEFFRITSVSESGRALNASIGDNINALHGHMLSHCDPLFLVVQQSPNRTTHNYSNRPEGTTYVKFSRDRGVDIVGKIDVSKAEIPGVSG